MLVSTTGFRFRVWYGNFELFKFLSGMRMVSIIQLRFFQSLLQLVHLMNFKRRTHIFWWLKIKKKVSNTSCWEKKRTEALLVLEKTGTEKNASLKNAC